MTVPPFTSSLILLYRYHTVCYLRRFQPLFPRELPEYECTRYMAFYDLNYGAMKITLFINHRLYIQCFRETKICGSRSITKLNSIWRLIHLKTFHGKTCMKRITGARWKKTHNRCFFLFLLTSSALCWTTEQDIIIMEQFFLLKIIYNHCTQIPQCGVGFRNVKHKKYHKTLRGSNPIRYFKIGARNAEIHKFLDCLFLVFYFIPTTQIIWEQSNI